MNLSDVDSTAINFDSYVGGRPSVQLVVDRDDNGTADGILVFEPWAYAPGNTYWTNGSGFGVPSGMGYASYGTLAQYQDANPSAKILAIGYSLGSGVLGDAVITDIVIGDTIYAFGLPVDTTAPEAPTNLRRVAANGDVIACGTSAQLQAVTPTWDKSVSDDVAYYEYSSFNPPHGTPGVVERNLGDVDHFDTGGWVSTTEGTGKFAVRAVDHAGNKSDWAECAITYDSTAPTAPVIENPIEGAYFTTGNILNK